MIAFRRIVASVLSLFVGFAVAPGLAMANETSVRTAADAKDALFGIIAAEESEISALRASASPRLLGASFGAAYYAGEIAGRRVVLVRCGIGKVNAALASAVLIEKFGVTHLINIGTAGALRDSPARYILVAKDAVQCDVDAESLGYGPGEIPELGTAYFAADRQMMDAALQACRDAGVHLPAFAGRVLTEDKFSTDASAIAAHKARFGGDCIEMEGAAVGQAAFRHGVPFAVIRVISNAAGGGGAKEYQRSRDTVAEMLNRIMHAMLKLM